MIDTDEYYDRLEPLIEYVNAVKGERTRKESDWLEDVIEVSLSYAEQGKDLKESYGRLLTASRYIVTTLMDMITRCKNEGVVEELHNYEWLIRSFRYDEEDIMLAYERLRDIFDRLAYTSTYFGLCERILA